MEATSHGTTPTDTAPEDLQPVFTRLQGGSMQANVSTSDAAEMLRSLGNSLSAQRLQPKRPARESNPLSGVRPDFASKPLRVWSAPELEYWFSMPTNRDFASLYQELWKNKSGRLAAGFIDALRQNDNGYLTASLDWLAVYAVIYFLFSVQTQIKHK